MNKLLQGVVREVKGMNFRTFFPYIGLLGQQLCQQPRLTRL
ncbi:hypothetical protein [Sodalinema gerasimenkoae]|nr:hypothetical protein [Sodalinema gerasimenkoae]